MPNPFGLTDQQKRFADGVLTGKSQRQAYESAGYRARGKVADAAAARLLTNVKVAAYVENRRQKLQEKTEVTQERITQELARIAFSNMRNLAVWGPRGVRLRRSRALPEDITAAVAEVSQTITETGGSLKFKLHDKKGALDSLAKIMGMMKDTSINIDVSDLSMEELERIANGEDPISVIASTRSR
jgi:phage terminase small subunit